MMGSMAEVQWYVFQCPGTANYQGSQVELPPGSKIKFKFCRHFALIDSFQKRERQTSKRIYLLHFLIITCSKLTSRYHYGGTRTLINGSLPIPAQRSSRSRVAGEILPFWVGGFSSHVGRN